MNFLPVIIGVLLFSLFSDKGGGKQSGGSGNAIDMENIQNTVGAINSFNKLGGKDTDKMSVVMELMSNPVVAELVGKFLGNQPTSGADEKYITTARRKRNRIIPLLRDRISMPVTRQRRRQRRSRRSFSDRWKISRAWRCRKS